MYCIMSMTIDVFAIHNEEDKLQLLMIFCGGPILLIKGFSLNLDTQSYQISELTLKSFDLFMIS